ncbi:hypothetical protein O6H91_14G006900 [Diphasiastrum complanatum]|nr:hypothetical protein O6H91_14G006900 [Diphasiastrum complanatum]
MEGEEEEAIGFEGLIVPLNKKGKELNGNGKLKIKDEETIKSTEADRKAKKQEDEGEEDIKVKLQEKKKEAEEEEEKLAEEERQRDTLERPIHGQLSVVDPSDYALKDIELSTPRPVGEKSATHDLVENMHYLFIRVVKARELAEKHAEGSCDAYVKVSIGNQSLRTRAIHKSLNPSWNQVFAFGKERMGAQSLEVTLWAEDTVNRDDFLGSVSFELAEIPTRRQPDSPLAPQWYRLDETQEGRVKGEVMLAVWMGTQADEAFTEAWQSDSGDYANTRSKVYIAPKLWYIRVSVVEAQDVQPLDRLRLPELSVRAQLGFQILKTSFSRNRSTSPSWNEDLMFVAAEPFEDDLILTIEDRVSPMKEDQLGYVRIPLSSIERRVDSRPIASRWFDVERIKNLKPVFHGRMHLRVCFEGGYHVMDEPMSYISCIRPTAKQLWKPNIGLLELGIICAKGLVPMKTRGGRGTTDSYCVAKYGQKWVRTRTIVDNFNPCWNEQYTWEVHDPCTVITVAVMDNWHLHFNPDETDADNKDGRIGKVRIRLSALERNRVYTNRYPLLMLQQLGVKKMGEIELAVRFSTSSMLETLQIYSEPLLPKLHYSHPLGVAQTEKLRIAAMRVSSIRLSRSEPPLRQEVVQYVLEPDSTAWSLRRSRANYYRILNVLSEPLALINRFDGICKWKNKFKTIVAHLLFCFLVCFPRFVLPMLFVFFFLKGAWLFRFRARSPPSIDAKLSQAEQVDPEELDEEFDPIPSTKDSEIVRVRYDRLRVEAAKIQNMLGDLATEGERILALFTWRDPRATLISTVFWLPMAFILYLAPIRLVVMLLGFYTMRHPNFRKPIPPVPLRFFKRLPSLKDHIL